MKVVGVEHSCPSKRCHQCHELLDPGTGWCPNCRLLFGELASDVAECGNCTRAWCALCQPAPSAMCVWCNGMGVEEHARMAVDLDDPHDVIAFLKGEHHGATAQAQATG